MKMDGEEVVLDVESVNPQNNMKSDSESVITDSIINSYFSHCNVLSKNIISEQRSLVKFLGDRWNEFDCDRRDALLDLLFVEDDIRQQLGSLSKDDEVIQESFPRLYLNSGQKINVDDVNDLWTWRDEHSGPFSWMSRSQQDLTLIDLEPDNISKPQPKTLRVDTENPENLKSAEKQFSLPANCWLRDILDNYAKTERSITISPCVSVEFGTGRQQQREEVNKGFEDVNEDEQRPSSSTHSPPKEVDAACVQSEPQESQEPGNDSVPKRINSNKDKKRRSPSPKKILRSSSLRRSPSKCSDQGEQQLISKQSDDSYEEHNSFSNPLVETQWSSFVGENDKTEQVQERDSIPMKAVGRTYTIPAPQVMERGTVGLPSSPYQVQKDNVNLITPSDSPAQSHRGSNLYTMTNDQGGWSSESTPDHTTHLLKGMEDKSKAAEPPVKFKPSAVERYEQDEVLTIENQGGDIMISTESKPEENKRDSDIPTTGFDFLDNW